MFPEAFAETWIGRLTSPGELVLDPFCGRGTTPFQAILMGRTAVGNDINPVAFCITKAKTNAPARSSLLRRLSELERAFLETDCADELTRLPLFFSHAFCETALRQLVFLRSRLRWSTSRTDCMLAAITLGALHGESDKSKAYLSNQMPRTISTKPDYSIRFWALRGLEPPDRDVFEVLRQRIDFRYASTPPPQSAVVRQGDFRSLPAQIGSLRRRVKLVVTSPPYLDTTNFEEDQWLRLWFLGGQPNPTYGRVSRDDRHERPEAYWQLIADMWRVLGQVLAKDAYVVVRMGGRKLTPDRIVSGLEATAMFTGRAVSLVSSEESLIGRRQTDAFRPGSTGCVSEVDCCFQVS